MAGDGKDRAKVYIGFTWGLHRVYMGFVRWRQRDDGEIRERSG